MANSCRSQPVENAELAFAQAFVDDGPRRPARERALFTNDRRRLLGPDVGGREDDLRPFVPRKCGEPAAGGLGLLYSKGRERHVDIAHLDVDLVSAGLIGRVARDIALALAMPDQPQPLRPILPHCFLLERLKAPQHGLCQLKTQEEWRRASLCVAKSRKA